MKQLFYLLFFGLLMGCAGKKHETDLSFAMKAIENANFMLAHHVKKFAYEYPNDPVVKQCHKLVETTERSCLIADSSLLALRSENATGKRQLDEAMKIVAGWRNTLESEYFQTAQLPEETQLGTIDEARLYLRSCLHAYLQHTSSKVTDICIVTDLHRLQTQSQNTQVKLGDRFSCLTTFESNTNRYEGREAIKLEKMLLNNVAIPGNKVHAFFGNRYFEYTPDKPGQYKLVFSKSEQRSSGKTKTYISEISFEVTP